MTIRNLDRMFAPTRVALFGASPRPRSIGRTVARNLLQGGLPVSLINPHHDRVLDQPCLPSLAALDRAPDLAVLAVPAPAIPSLIAALGEAGTRAAVIITAGLTAENGLRQAVLDAARPHCLRLIGPNCLGIQVPAIGLDASFAHVAAKPGRLAFLSQSGALVTAVLDWAASRRIGFSHIVSLGDMADVDFGDALDYLAGERACKAILLYIEAVTNPRKFMSAARSAARAKPVVAIKAGRHAAAAKAARSHTGALAGSDRVYDAALHRAGVIRVTTLEDLFAAAETIDRLPGGAGERLAIITNGGGAGVLAVDRLIDLGGQLAALAPDTLARLDQVLPATWSHGNPVDIIGDAGPERYRDALETVLADESSDAVLVINCPTALTSGDETSAAVVAAVTKDRAAKGAAAKPVLTNWLGAEAAARARASFAGAEIATYDTPADAVLGFSHANGYHRAQQALMRVPRAGDPSDTGDPASRLAAARAAMKPAIAQHRTLLTEPEAKQLLSAYGIAVVPTVSAGDPDAVAAAAADLLGQGAPACVLKILSPDITHKSDAGGVRLDLETPEAARQAAEQMLAGLAQARPEARLHGFSVQAMVRSRRAIELIAGVADDATFGPVILFGAGGTAVEVVDDTAVALPPLDRMLAGDLIDRTRVARLFAGYRGLAPVDRDAVAEVLVRLSRLIAECPEIRELDINPLLADEQGATALDARLVIGPPPAPVRGGHPRFAIRPYPAAWVKTVTLADGRAVTLRPVRPQDEALYDAFFAKLDPRDVRLRLFAPVKVLSHRLVARLTQIDYSRAMAFAALIGEPPELAGVVRLSADPDYSTAEYAVIVRSDLKGLGLGWAMMSHLIDYARAEGLDSLYGSVLAENQGMLKMARELGFTVSPDPEDRSVLRVTLKLGA